MGGPRSPVSFGGRVVIVGFGSIAQGLVPLLFQALGVQPSQVLVVTGVPDRQGVARALGIELRVHRLTQANHAQVLRPLLRAGDFLLNLAVDVCSLDLVRLCHSCGAFYLDADNQPWPGRYENAALPPSQRSNYALREEMLAYGRDHPHAPTACITQGANPGLVNSFLKVALLAMAADLRVDVRTPENRREWAALARRLDVKVIHVAERDTQTTPQRRRRGEFVNTWSVDAFVDEGLQPAELGWGTHERHWPPDAQRHGYGCDAAILLDRPGMGTRVRSWAPLEGPYQGFLVTHAESISIADFLTVREAGQVAYRPTVHYAYHPCDDAVASIHELAGRHWRLQGRQRILREEISEGRDELGVLLMGNARGVYWYGSRLAIEQARALLPFNNATSLQVAAGILGAMVWALQNPERGVVEPDAVDHRVVMEAAMPWLGEVVGVWGDWTPLKDRSPLFPEPRDGGDPWQFVNFRVG
ncbi:homospermidine synthase [Ramlibacter sp. USB13]|uniref:Homospermidine synthase n=1 Tax=Ramlibacter cellulosilyticus TaxID=2764187 RepID=A0A923SAV7_9BURK|nr:saccharopine dehydrogenase C-terminal domain-containing protein [Ramlibacter cellulosilyticus]MBC5783159.1 homospermidine synthase [Ramlibacter cellulosilyticus]